MVALIRGLGSPTASKHSDLMKLITSGGRLFMCALTLFFRIKPDRDLNKKISQAVAQIGDDKPFIKNKKSKIIKKNY